MKCNWIIYRGDFCISRLHPAGYTRGERPEAAWAVETRQRTVLEPETETVGRCPGELTTPSVFSGCVKFTKTKKKSQKGKHRQMSPCTPLRASITNKLHVERTFPKHWRWNYNWRRGGQTGTPALGELAHWSSSPQEYTHPVPLRHWDSNPLSASRVS